MPYQCPKCGAVLKDGQLTCQSVYDEFLALELTDAEYGEVSLLTGACLKIQHGQYTDEALVWIEQRMRDYLEKGVPTEQIRKQVLKQTGQLGRAWKVTRSLGDPPQAKISWSMTIVDVASGYRDAGSYCELVKQWTRVTLQEMKPLLRASIA